MKQFLSKQWPFIAHLAASALVILSPAVQAQATAHPAYSALILAVWGKLLHRAESPKSSS